MKSLEDEIRRYLRTGRFDPAPVWFPGKTVVEVFAGYNSALRVALVEEVRRQSSSAAPLELPTGFNRHELARERLYPMVEGLFFPKERPQVFQVLAESLVFLSSSNIEDVLMKGPALNTAWTLANVFLGSLGLCGLDGAESNCVGLNEGNVCYVSGCYFKDSNGGFDYVVHEAAHLFHNWKREYAGLSPKQSQEWLLPIAFHKRELFAWSCEIYSCALRSSNSPRKRAAFVAECTKSLGIIDDRVDRLELFDVLGEAAAARNGWKRILARCVYGRAISVPATLFVAVEEEQAPLVSPLD